MGLRRAWSSPRGEWALSRTYAEGEGRRFSGCGEPLPYTEGEGSLLGERVGSPSAPMGGHEEQRAVASAACGNLGREGAWGEMGTVVVHPLHRADTYQPAFVAVNDVCFDHPTSCGTRFRS